MSTYTRRLYNVFKNKEPFGQSLRPIEISNLIGCDPNIPGQYSKTGSKFHGVDGIYSFCVAQETVHVKKATSKKKVPDTWKSEFTEKWNRMLKLFHKGGK